MNDTTFNFKGKTAVITGASRGIGQAIAENLLQSGCSVINFSRSPSSYFQNHPHYTHVSEDVLNIDSVRAWERNFSAKGEKIDFWINNAGVYLPSNLLNADESHWEQTFSVNVKSLFFLSQIAANHMKQNSGGVIINASSFAAKIPSAERGIYAASKSAVESLTRSMAAEWAQYNIRVNAYSPGAIVTDMTKELIMKKGDPLMKPIALNRYGSPNDVAKLVLFLCSNASSYMTGEVVGVSGGKFIIQNQEDVTNS
ncbi:MAG: SDR family oxidoreductase [Nanoarchaeota archaeon]